MTVLDGWAAAPTDISVDDIQGWYAVVTDGDTGDTYSGTVTRVSPYGFLFQQAE